MGDDDGSDEVAAAIGAARVSEQRIVPMDDRTRSLVKSIWDDDLWMGWDMYVDFRER
jgi:hypothetical protein